MNSAHISLEQKRVRVQQLDKALRSVRKRLGRCYGQTKCLDKQRAVLDAEQLHLDAESLSLTNENDRLVGERRALIAELAALDPEPALSVNARLVVGAEK